MKQLSLPESKLVLCTHGGQRKGAGRKASKNKSKQNHIVRETFSSKDPVHVTVKFVKGLKSLRTRVGYRLLREASFRAQLKGLKIVQFSLQKDHIHLLVEAENNKVLAKGMQAFCVSFAKRFNHFLGRTGQVFFDRYHMHILKTLREVKHALKYVLFNSSKHKNCDQFVDLYSSAPHFFLWKELVGRPLKMKSSMSPKYWQDMDLMLSEMLCQPSTWKLRYGWMRG